ncbi:unnamed protein product [Tuber aestivum]|uniref:Probable endonuclease LCL3 n=1 Tax=Tuber aestivum TaxID=59557 RepID=A0A292PL46_9PEZI|nr:unnamed protein product [Tuber aestivum]
MSGSARVKSVLSGDTLILQSVKSAGLEKTLALAYVSAPRLKREGDEPFAFQSRDFLRKATVGKEVKFQVLYTVPNTNREYGLVLLPNGESLLEKTVSEGWVKVREDAGKRENQPDNETTIEKLKELEVTASTERKGVWCASDDGRIETNYEYPPASEAVGFLEKHKGRTVSGIIERVIAGDRAAIRLFLGPKLHQELVVLIAGVRTPLTKRVDASGNEQLAEEYGEQAKSFVESRLLQRSVDVTLLDLSPQSQFIGNVIHPQSGNIAEALLKQGLGRCQDFHSTMIGSSMVRLRAAEKHARENRLHLWKDHVVKVPTSNPRDAIVTRIVNADTIFVRNKAGVEKKINLSSVRQPKPTDPKQAPFQAEAKEFLRKKLIGKHVVVTIDGKRAATEGYDEREMTTVIFNNKNVALSLVENGWASAVKHGRRDEDRSPIYDELLAAEVAAQRDQKGMYAPKPPASSKLVEVSENITKAKAYLSFLQRQKRIPAVVDFVSSGSRFKVIIPRESVRLTLVLGGIRAPRTARNPAEESEPFGPEALEYASRRCMQRDVEIDVIDIDRVGGFIGTMYVNRENVAKGLVEEGLAAVHHYSAEKSGNGNELFAAEKRAKEARKGLWHDWSPEDDGENSYDSPVNVVATEEVVEPRTDYRDIIITNIDDQGRLKVQVVGTGTSALEEMMTAFKNFHLLPQNNKGLEGPPRVGELVAAKFTDDNSFYRARVRHVNREAREVEVMYIDYGNSEKLPFSRLRPLSQPQFQTAKLMPQAIDASLSFIQFPTVLHYAQESVDALGQMTNGKQLVANVDYVGSDGALYLTLYDPKESDRSESSINAELVSEGLAMVALKLRPFERAYPAKLNTLKEREALAKGERKGMWEYGDITED